MVSKRERAQRIVRAAGKEYRAYKRMTLKKSKASLWEECGQIHFYCTVMEYFERYGGEYQNCWGVLDGITLPIRAMWNCYLKYEGLEYLTARGVEIILEQMEEDMRYGSPD